MLGGADGLSGGQPAFGEVRGGDDQHGRRIGGPGQPSLAPGAEDRVGLGERRELSAIEAGATGEILDIGEGTFPARLYQAGRGAPMQPPHQAQAEAKPPTAPRIP